MTVIMLRNPLEIPYMFPSIFPTFFYVSPSASPVFLVISYISPHVSPCLLILDFIHIKRSLLYIFLWKVPLIWFCKPAQHL